MAKEIKLPCLLCGKEFTATLFNGRTRAKYCFGCKNKDNKMGLQKL